MNRVREWLLSLVPKGGRNMEYTDLLGAPDPGTFSTLGGPDPDGAWNGTMGGSNPGR